MRTRTFWSDTVLYCNISFYLANKWGHPLADRSQARTPYRPSFFDGGFSLYCCPALLLQIEPVSSMLAATESRLSPIWIKRRAMNCHRPGGIPPQRNLGTAKVSGQSSQIRGSRHAASNPQLAHPADDPVQQHTNYTGGDDRPPLRHTGSSPDPIAGLPAIT